MSDDRADIIAELTFDYPELDERDVRIDVYTSGVHVRSSVRVTHLPTGRVVTCDDAGSILRNKAEALRRLRALLTPPIG